LEDQAMNVRITQLLLTVIAVLLAAHLFRSTAPAAQANENGEVPEVLRARMLELVDEEGRVRANLKVEEGGEVVFRLRDVEGTIRVKIGAGKDGSGLVLMDDRTEPAVQLLAKPAGTSMTLSEEGKAKRVITP
jgi:hypothetical protein